jgi:hypothetical protein
MTEENTVTNHKSNNRTNNRVTMLMLVAVFVVPFLLAVLALKGDWFNGAATNRGELLTPPVEMPDLLRGETPVWRIVYFLPDSCEQKCENALYSLNQIWEASGREKERVIPTVVATESSDSAALAEVQSKSQIRVLTSQQQSLLDAFKAQDREGLFVADTLGNVILRYSINDDRQAAIMKSRDVLADLKKLLKLSRIG